MKSSPVLAGQELEIMKIVWQLGSATVRDAYEALLERRRIAYTTVMTTMKILEQKGHLKKKLRDRAYVYRATRPRDQVIGGMVREFVNRVFNGATSPLLVHLVAEHAVSEEDLAEARRRIAESKRRKP